MDECCFCLGLLGHQRLLALQESQWTQVREDRIVLNWTASSPRVKKLSSFWNTSKGAGRFGGGGHECRHGLPSAYFISGLWTVENDLTLAVLTWLVQGKTASARVRTVKLRSTKTSIQINGYVDFQQPSHYFSYSYPTGMIGGNNYWTFAVPIVCFLPAKFNAFPFSWTRHTARAFVRLVLKIQKFPYHYILT